MDSALWERFLKLPLRSIICAPAGKSLISLDLSAAETWIVAHLANDPNMISQLATGDIHSFSARVVFEKSLADPVSEQERYIGKKVNHSASYRTSPYKMCEFINKEGNITVSLHQVKQWHARWHSTFMIRQWWNDIEERLRIQNRRLTTTYKRSRTFYGLWNDDLLKEATAYEPQSTVADHMRGRLHPELQIPGGIREIRKQITSQYPEILEIQTAHDSILLECPTSLVSEIGERCYRLLKRPLIIRDSTFTIPVDCDIYPERWGEGKRKLKFAA